MSSGKVLDFRDSLMSDLKKSDKYQIGVQSASQLAQLDAYAANEKTADKISRRDQLNKMKYLKGELDSFELSGLRAEYDAIDAANYYEGERPDFNAIFSQQYSAVVHNWSLENDDANHGKLTALAENMYPGDPNGKEKVPIAFSTMLSAFSKEIPPSLLFKIAISSSVRFAKLPTISKRSFLDFSKNLEIDESVILFNYPQ